jgi:hypothetical protein
MDQQITAVIINRKDNKLKVIVLLSHKVKLGRERAWAQGIKGKRKNFPIVPYVFAKNFFSKILISCSCVGAPGHAPEIEKRKNFS